MKENLKIKAVLGDDTATMVSELQVLLNEELTRPEDQRDFDYISELTQSIAELSGASLTEEEQERNISAIMTEVSANRNRSKISVVRRVLSAACSFALIFAAANCISFASFGSDIFHATVNFGQSGYVVDFANTDPNKYGIPTKPPVEAQPATAGATAAQTTAAVGATEAHGAKGPDPDDKGQMPVPGEDDAQSPTAGVTEPIEMTEAPMVTEPMTRADAASQSGIRSAIGSIIRNRCESAGFTPVTPPDDYLINMELEDFSRVEMEKSEDYYFTFSNDTQQIDVVLEHYPNRYEMPELKIPGDTYRFSAEDYPVGQVFFFEDENVNTALFVNNDTIYTIIVQNIDMDELHDIIAVFGGRN